MAGVTGSLPPRVWTVARAVVVDSDVIVAVPAFVSE